MMNLKSLENTARYRKTKKGVVTNIYHKMKSRNSVSFSLQYLHEFSKSQKFNRLFLEWEKSKYNKQFKPTIDRINQKSGYEVGNIQWMTWADNRYKQRMEVNLIRARRVGRFLGDKLLEEYTSVSDAVRKSGVMQGNLSSCLSGKRKTASGYVWKYTDSRGRSHSIKEIKAVCKYCSIEFIPQCATTKFCSKRCGVKYNKNVSKPNNIYSNPELISPAPSGVK